MSVSEFSLKRRVQFYETDAAGIVHFSTYLRYMEEAEHALWREAGLSLAPRNSEIGWPRVSVSFDYQRPLRFEDEFEIRIRIVELGEKKIRYVCTVTCAEARVGTGTMTVVCVARRPNEPMKSVPIPQEIATRFKVASDSGEGS